jgi:hypothetical protein
MRFRTATCAFVVVLAAVLTTILASATYNLDAKFEGFADDFDALTDEVVEVIDEHPNQVGLVSAQAIIDARKPDLKQKLEEVKRAAAWRVGGATVQRFQASIAGDTAKISNLLSRDVLKQAARQDPGFIDQMRKLRNSYMSIISGDEVIVPPTNSEVQTR